MPTALPRYQVTETQAVARALDIAAQRWPHEKRSRLLLRLVQLGGATLEEEQRETARSRVAAIDSSSGKYADAFGDGYLADLRADWPA